MSENSYTFVVYSPTECEDDPEHGRAMSMENREIFHARSKQEAIGWARGIATGWAADFYIFRVFDTSGNQVIEFSTDTNWEQEV